MGQRPAPGAPDVNPVADCVRELVDEVVRSVSSDSEAGQRCDFAELCGQTSSKKEEPLLPCLEDIKQDGPSTSANIASLNRSSFLQAEVARNSIGEPSALYSTFVETDPENENEHSINSMPDNAGSVLSIIVDNKIASSVSEIGSNINPNLQMETESSDIIPAKRRGRGKAKSKNEKREPNNPIFWTEGDLERNEVGCFICLGIYIQPVSFPCTHSICLACYHQHVDVTSLYCPICRYRLSIWSRRSAKENSLVNLPFWERIQQQFPDDVANRLAGKDDEAFQTLSESEMKCRDGIMARKGEIKSEFETGLEQFRQELQIERHKEEEASTEFILKLQEEEPLPPPPQSPSELQADFELAKKLQEEEERVRQEAVILRTSLRSASTSTASQSSSSSNSKSKATKSNKKRGSPSSSSSQAKKTKRQESLEGQRKISHFFAASPADSGCSSSVESKHVGVNYLDLGENTEVNLGPGSSASIRQVLPTSHRNSSPGAQSRVSDSDDDSDNEPLAGKSRGIYPGLYNSEDDGTGQDSMESGDSQRSLGISLLEILQRQEMEEQQWRKEQEEADRKFALRLQAQLRKELEPKPDYSLRPKRDKQPPGKR